MLNGSRGEFHPLQGGRGDQLLRSGRKCGQRLLRRIRIGARRKHRQQEKRWGIGGPFQGMPCLSKFQSPAPLIAVDLRKQTRAASRPSSRIAMSSRWGPTTVVRTRISSARLASEAGGKNRPAILVDKPAQVAPSRPRSTQRAELAASGARSRQSSRRAARRWPPRFEQRFVERFDFASGSVLFGERISENEARVRRRSEMAQVVRSDLRAQKIEIPAAMRS